MHCAGIGTGNIHISIYVITYVQINKEALQAVAFF